MSDANSRKLSRRLTLLLPLALGQCTEANDMGEPQEASTSGATGTTSDEDPVPTTGPTTTDGPETTEISTTSTAETGEGSTTGASTTTPAEPHCGDGILQEGEECDDGVVENTLGRACLPTCVASRCGDGFVQTGVEECDFGDGINELKYGGCIPVTCKWGPRCGDGDLDVPDEVCDPADPNGQGGELAGCAVDCRFKGRLAFLSSVAYTGNLGGLAGADALCQDLAATFDTAHADRYMAWLSDGKSSPLQRIDHAPEYDDVPYVLRSGLQVAASFDDLVKNGPWPGIDITDKYESISDIYVWTNTAVDGSRFSDLNHCQEWGSDAVDHSARIGRNRLAADSPDLEAWKQFGQWTSYMARTCDGKRRIYCFEN